MTRASVLVAVRPAPAPELTEATDHRARMIRACRRARARPRIGVLQSMPRRKYATTMTPAERSERARLAAYARWAKPADPTASARAASYARFYEAADALGVTDALERERMAAQARRAEGARLRFARLRRLARDDAAQAGEAV